MPELVQALLIVVASFVIGGIPWSIIVARIARRPDPRTIGSGRTGGANAMRAMGPQLALVSGLLDMLKGTAAVLLARWFDAGTAVEVVAAPAAIIGHSRSVFLGLGGGRGVAPAFGGLLAFAPLIALIIIPVFILIIAVTRYSSVGSLAGSALAGILLAWATAALGWDPWLYLYAAGGTLLVWLFHTDNIQRLLAGTENRIGTPRESAGASGLPGPADPGTPSPPTDPGEPSPPA
jgi:glycerol-3-phosphate acyltransferase PlsY